MNINATLEKLSAMRLNGFERAYRQLTDNVQQEKFTIHNPVRDAFAVRVGSRRAA